MKKLKTAILIFISLTFSACTFNTKVDELLTPPKLTEQQTAIFEALQNAVGKNIKLKYPKSGDHRSAFVLANLDDEPTDEALVFYELQTGESNTGLLRVNILDQEKGVWFSTFDFAGFGSEVDEVIFSNLGTTGETKIIIGYSALNQMQKSLSVLTYKNKVLTELISNAQYSYMDVLDLNLDNSEELIVLNQDSSTQIAKATLYKTNEDNVFYKVTETENIETATEYTKISVGYAQEGLYGLFIDYSKGNNQYGTEFLYYMGNRLFNPISETNQNTSTSRSTNTFNTVVSSKDIDGDGIVEIPSTVPFPGYETLNKQEQFSATIWHNLVNGNLSRKAYTYSSVKNNFIFVFPERWRDAVTATITSELNEVVFSKATKSQTKPDFDLKINDEDFLLKIKTIDTIVLAEKFADEESELLQDGYEKLSSNGTKFYFIKFGNKNDDMSMTKEDILENFLVQKTES